MSTNLHCIHRRQLLRSGSAAALTASIGLESLLALRHSNATTAGAPQRGSIGCVALSPKR
jgi:hypothetical protein